MHWAETDRESHPINCVSYVQAEAYCASVGKRLPLEEEWELAAVGHTTARYPWGNEPPAGRICSVGPDGDISQNSSHTCPVGSHPRDVSPYGVLDLAGSVREHTSSIYCHYPKSDYAHECAPHAHGNHVVRGGQWNDSGEKTVWFRTYKYPTQAEPGVGFRCAR